LRRLEEWSIHDQAVDAVAKQRMNFPSKDEPRRQTYTNPDQKHVMGIGQGNDLVYPDIVVVDLDKKEAIILGEVETESTVDDQSAEQWSDYSRRVNGSFYLYVPEGYEADARKILESNGIKYLGIRTYAFDRSGNVVFNVVK